MSEFADEAGLGAYAVSPEHVDVVESLIKPCLAAPPIALDYFTEAALVDAGSIAMYHVVLFKLKEDASSEQYDTAAKALCGLTSLQVCCSNMVSQNKRAD